MHCALGLARAVRVVVGYPPTYGNLFEARLSTHTASTSPVLATRTATLANTQLPGG